MHVENIKGNLRLLAKCLAMLMQERLLFALLITLSIFVALTEGMTVSLLVPILDAQSGSSGTFQDIPFFGQVSEYFGNGDRAEKLKLVSLVLGGVIFVRGIAQYCVTAVGAVIPIRMRKRIIEYSYDCLVEAQLSYMFNRDVGTFMNILTQVPDRTVTILQNFADIIWNCAVILIYLVVMVMISPEMTVMSLLFMLLMSYVLKKISHGPIREAGTQVTNSDSTVSHLLYETMNGIKLVHLLVAEKLMSNTVKEALEVNRKARQRSALFAQLPSPFLSITAGVFICYLLYFSVSFDPENQEKWISLVLLFLFVMMRLLSPVSTVNAARARIANHLHAFQLLEKFQEEAKAAAQSNGDIAFEGLQTGVSFENVTFTYDGADNVTISDLTLNVPKGKMVAVVGPSGAGKSTLVGLTARLFDPQKGKVTVDGTDLRDLDVGTWRRHISVVSQDIVIFNTTAANNISFAKEGLSLDDVKRAAKLAHADEFIEALPEGYDTVLGDRGVRLSGGQQQRLAIARAIFSNPDLIIFDEATSQLDSITESAIQNSIDLLKEGRTLLVVAHRLSTIRRADVIVVMKDGQVVEEGSHAELIKSAGPYKDMLEHQNLDLVDTQ